MQVEALITAPEIASKAGVQPTTIHSYSRRGFMPPPITRLGSLPLWDRAEIDSWLKARPGRGGHLDRFWTPESLAV
jgi:predicted DNA-binding transcriptional regulator AlpA